MINIKKNFQLLLSEGKSFKEYVKYFNLAINLIVSSLGYSAPVANSLNRLGRIRLCDRQPQSPDPLRYILILQ